MKNMMKLIAKSILRLGLVSSLSLTMIGQSALSRENISADRYEVLTGNRMDSADSKNLWDEKYGQHNYVYGKNAAKFLIENYHYIPPKSTILDVGMGEGRNAVFLAQKGYSVTGIDISSVAVKKAHMLAKERNVNIKTITASALKYNIPENSYDAIICFYYLDRALIQKMKKWLRPGGVLIFEAYTERQRTIKKMEGHDVRYLLKAGELLNLFNGMTILKYEEPLHENEYRASIILKKGNDK